MTATAHKLLALALAVPIAWGVHAGLMALRGSDESFPGDHPVAPKEAARFADGFDGSLWPTRGDWPMFQHDPRHTGRASAALESADLVPAWSAPFNADAGHKWEYKAGSVIWSPPVVGRIPAPAGEPVPMVFFGSYARRLHALDARTGTEVWHRDFTDGSVQAAPALAMVEGKAMLIAACSDRVIYALDALTGTKVWAYETRAWSQSVAEARMSSPTPYLLDGKPVMFLGAWNGDRSGLDNVQDGSLYCFDLRTGKPIWSQRLGTSPVTSPALARVGHRDWVFAACEDGSLRALDARTGEAQWHFTMHQELRSSPALGVAGGIPLLFIGTRFHSVYGIGAYSGNKVWRFQTGYWIDGTPAVGSVGGKTRVFAGSYDQGLYSFDGAGQGRVREPAWSLQGANQYRSSPITLTVAGKPAVLAMCWDGSTNLFDAADGKPLWSHRAGRFLFSHEFEGDSLWASPAAAEVSGKTHVFVPAHDGKFYCFRSR